MHSPTIGVLVNKLSISEEAKLTLIYDLPFNDTYLRRHNNTRMKHMVFKQVLNEAIDKIEFKKDKNGGIYINRNDKDNDSYTYSWSEFLNLKNSKEEVLFNIIEKFINQLSLKVFDKKLPLKQAVEKLFILNDKPFDIEIEFNDHGGIIDIPFSENDSEIIHFDKGEMEKLNPDKLDKIAKYFLTT